MTQDSLARSVGPALDVPSSDHGPGSVEVLIGPEHLAAPAAAALGWDGAVLPPAIVLGRRVVVIADLLADVHADRVTTGWGPVTDRTTVSTWNWPEMQHMAPPPAVRLRGVLAPARHWRTALTAAVAFAGLCPTALLLPSDVARDQYCLARVGRHGPSVVAAAGPGDLDPDAVDVVSSGRPAAVATSRPTAVSRWVHEVVYQQVLA